MNRVQWRKRGLVFALVFTEVGARLSYGYESGAIILQPVAPKTLPPSDYPIGTIITGQEIILGSVPARVWLDVYATDWAPDDLKTVQVTISATDAELDGGGYSGEDSNCNGEHMPDAGDLRPAMQPCEKNEDCRALSGSACTFLEASKCMTWDGTFPGPYFPAGKWCAPCFQDLCRGDWIGYGIANSVSVDMSTLDYRLGATQLDPGFFFLDFQPSYVGTLVLDVPSNAKGTYVIDFQENQTFLQMDGPPGNDGPVAVAHAAKITVPCGRCCYELGDGSPQCVDHVTADECAGYGTGSAFAANEVCPQDGGAPCPACGLDEHCDDGVFCNGVEVCEANDQCGPGQPPCRPWEECEEATDSCAPRIPTVSHWGLVMLILAMLIFAKVRGKPVETGGDKIS